MDFRSNLFLAVSIGLVWASVSALLDGRFWHLLPGWRPDRMPDLSGKVAIVTGPSLGGIGHISALEMARNGAHVILAGRNSLKGFKAVRDINQTLPGAKVEFMKLDLGSLQSVKEFAVAFQAKQLPLHILLNNAGIMMTPFRLTPDGFEEQFATNHLGHFLLTNLLLPQLESSAPSRVVTVSSAAAYGPGTAAKWKDYVPGSLIPKCVSSTLNYSECLRADYEPEYSPVMAYLRSKLANVLFARALSRRLGDKKVYSNAVNPGGIQTNLFQPIIQNWAAPLFGEEFSASVFGVFASFFMLSREQGAVTQLFLATAAEVEEEGIRGQLYKPQARAAGLPHLVSDEAEDHLWNLSMTLVKEFL